jgi:hypothetical protein
MPLINFQPNPKIPPIGFFEPISVDPKDMMTDVEFLLGVVKKLNEIILQTNKNTEFIDEYSGKIEEIEREIVSLRQEMTDFEIEVNNSITTQFNAIKIELQSMIATALTQANAYTDSVAATLENEIQQISIGQISVFDPTSGIYSPLQIVIDNLYNSSRENALTATEYDALELSATAYDAYELTATEYDQSGKTLLV